MCFRNILGQLADAMPQAVTITLEEREAIERVCIFPPHFSLHMITFLLIISFHWVIDNAGGRLCLSSIFYFPF